tara:strand:+ start:776 stop:1057 length:282 start_codon:yes stop_codon:yes gene_type:complete
MTKMADFTLEELMLFIIGVMGALGGLLLTLQKSKCKSICWGCCVRDVDAVIKEEKLEITGHTGDTPRKKDAVELNIVDKNEEILSNKNKTDGK